MSVLDLTAATGILKERYTQNYVRDLLYKKNALFALVKKRTDIGGYQFKVPVRYGTTAGGSSAFTSAQQNVSPSQYAGFLVTTSTEYSYGSISGQMIRAGKGSENTFVEALANEIDGAMITCTRGMAVAGYRNGGGARGKGDGSYSVAGAAITLATLADITNFEPNMVLEFSSDDGTGGAGVRAGTVTVSKINGNTGVITCTGNVNAGIGAAVNTDYIFRKGDYNNTAKGLGAWILSSSPASNDSFYGVNRSVFSNRLAGVNYSGSGAPMEETIVDVAARVCREGGSPDYLFMNPLDWASLVKALGAKVFYEEAKPTDTAKIGFRAVRVDGPEGPIKCVQDLNCPKGTSYMLTLDTWALYSSGPAPSILDDDGPMFLRDASTDTYSFRVGAYYAWACNAPGCNASITW